MNPSQDISNIKCLESFKILRFVSWPSQGGWPTRIRVVVLSSILAISFFAAFISVCLNWNEQGISAQICYVILVMGEAFVVSLFFIKNTVAYQRVLNNVSERLVIPRKTSEENTRKIDACERFSKRFFIFWYAMALMVDIPYCLSPLVEAYLHENSQNGSSVKNLPLPVKAWFPFDINFSPIHEVVYFILGSAMFIVGLYFVVFDSLFISCVIHICCQFEILCESLKNVKENSMKILQTNKENKCPRNVSFLQEYTESYVIGQIEFGDEPYITRDQNLGNHSKWDINKFPSSNKERNNHLKHDICTQEEMDAELTQCLFSCIEHHQDIYRSIDELNTLLRPMILVIVLDSTIVLTLTTFEMMVTSVGTVKFAGVVQILLCTLIHPFIYCWFSDLVATKSDMVCEAAFSSDWTEAPLAFKTCLRTVLTRTSKTATFTVGQFNPISLQTFQGIVKFAYSTYAVLRQVYNP